MADQDIRDVVKEKYGSAAKQAVKAPTKVSSCCGSRASEPASIVGTDPITRDLYSAEEAGLVPSEALAVSFGCGNPTALADLAPGEIVLDLGSGGGIDVLLSARRVGPTGKAYGLDMTPEMLEIARQNQAKSGVSNAEFLEGTLEAIPLPDASVDVIISNCVVNLAADKDVVLREAFRVLRPGGRFAVSDIVIRRELPDALRKSMELWMGCVAGALLETEYKAKLEAAGFSSVDIEPTRVFGGDDAKEMLASASSPSSAGAAASCCGSAPGPISEETLRSLDGAVISAFIRAVKPRAAS